MTACTANPFVETFDDAVSVLYESVIEESESFEDAWHELMVQMYLIDDEEEEWKSILQEKPHPSDTQFRAYLKTGSEVAKKKKVKEVEASSQNKQIVNALPAIDFQSLLLHMERFWNS